MEKLNNIPEKTIIFNQETGEASLMVKTTAKNMIKDIHKAFEEMQQMAGIEEKE